jgi:hypothetical protein
MEDLIMKKLIMFSMLIAIAVPLFSGIASAQPVCLVVCPTDAGDGDEVTVTAYDENDEWVDFSDLEFVTLGFGDAGEVAWSLGGINTLDVSSGHGVFTITQEMLDSDTFSVYTYPPEGFYRFSLAHPEWEAPFDTVAEAVAAGGSCAENLMICGAGPKIAIVDANDIYEPYDAGPPPGPPEAGPTSDKMLVSLPAVPYAANTITVIIDPNLEGAGKHEDFIFPASVAGDGSVTLIFTQATWDIQQKVRVEAVQDTDREGDENYDVLFTFSDLLGDPNFNSDPCEPLITSITVVDNDIPVVLGSPDPIEISENDPCTCVDLKIKLSHLPTHDVYVLVEPFDWAFEDPAMAYLDPPLGAADDPNKLKFTTSDWDLEQTITVCPIDDDELKEAWYEWIEGLIYFNVFSEDVRYLAPWLNPDGSEADDPGTEEEETSNGQADQDMFSVVLVQDNECGAIGFSPWDYNEDCTVGLADFVHYYGQWLICTQPYEAGCVKYWDF